MQDNNNFGEFPPDNNPWSLSVLVETVVDDGEVQNTAQDVMMLMQTAADTKRQKAADAAEKKRQKAAEEDAENMKILIANTREITGGDTKAASQLPEQDPKFPCPKTRIASWIWLTYCIFLRGSLLSEYAYTCMKGYKGSPDAQEDLEKHIRWISAAILAAANDNSLTESMRIAYAIDPSDMPHGTAKNQKLTEATSKCLTEVLRLLRAILLNVKELLDSEEVEAEAKAEAEAMKLLLSGIMGDSYMQLSVELQLSIGQAQHGMTKKLTEFEVRERFQKLSPEEQKGFLFVCNEMHIRTPEAQTRFRENVARCRANGAAAQLPFFIKEALGPKNELDPNKLTPRHTTPVELEATTLEATANILHIQVGINLFPCSTTCSMPNYGLMPVLKLMPDMFWNPDERDCMLSCVRIMVVEPEAGMPMSKLEMSAGLLPRVHAFNSAGQLRPLYTLEPGTGKAKPRRCTKVAREGGSDLKRRKRTAQLALAPTQSQLPIENTTNVTEPEPAPANDPSMAYFDQPGFGLLGNTDEDTTSRTELPSAPAADPQSTECIEAQLLKYIEDSEKRASH